MPEPDIIRAWKDPDYRTSLSRSQLERLPKNPAGLIELTDSSLNLVAGGDANQPQSTEAWLTLGCNDGCDHFTDNTYCSRSCDGPTCLVCPTDSPCIG